MRGLKSPLNYPVSDVKVWGRNITHGLYDQGNIGLIPHFDVETLCKYITIKNYTMGIIACNFNAFSVVIYHQSMEAKRFSYLLSEVR